MQLGHRKSVDLDLFGAIDASSEEIRGALSVSHSITVVKEFRNINIYLIAAMKIAAVVGRGTKKDFIDLFFLLQQYSLQEVLQFYLQKYPDGSLFIALKSLSYFEDAEPDPMPVMLEKVNWEDVKARIKQAVATFVG